MERHTLKEALKGPDPLETVAGRLIADFRQNWRRLLWVLAVVALVAGSLIGRQMRVASRDRKAADAFTEILAKKSGSETEAVGAGLWEAFLKKYGDSSLAVPARFYLGRAYLEGKEPEKALAAYREADRSAASPYRYLAREGQANAYMALKKWGEAEKLWAGLASAEDNPLRARHTWSLGLAQEAGAHAERALQTYKDFVTKFSGSPLLERVQMRLWELERRAPPQP
jgi:hypothetical protein